MTQRKAGTATSLSPALIANGVVYTGRSTWEDISPQGPFTAITKRTLYIHNPHSYPVAFKVKTTAPKQYSVRPYSGRIEPGDSVDVNIMLQPMAEEPPAHAKCKDKFLVQSAFIHADDEVRSLSQMWTLLEQTNKAGIEEKKLKVVFLAPEGQADGQGIPEEMEDSRIEESFNDPHDGLTRWTTKPEKEYDPALFPNKGLSVWEDPCNKPIYVPKAPVLHKPVTVGTHLVYASSIFKSFNILFGADRNHVVKEVTSSAEKS
ncbi:hypothetical protein L202_05838 [Cryptococcus amylolentus CBS 6039]|uniref:MSP domain-containing protein n=1 Tax=Cryptococcus amylolentus CBS 6039 TaxID=1295533 RepID=A0A1E3HI84_9TREE|nr:hypothetical protein L202_05838 [Cryptococcus amylolentus CBS 6039]ODN75845.1 hypothetical protein L202_05838 [Cryptococcus amylolentus CBS 6039]